MHAAWTMELDLRAPGTPRLPAGDTDLLAQVLAGGAPLYPPGYRSPEGRRGGSQDGSEDGSGSWTTLSRSDSAASGGLAEGQEGRAASEGGEQAPAPAGSEAGEPTAGRGAGRRGARRGARREREGEGDASVEDGDEDGVSFLDELEEARDRDRTALHMAAFLSMPACIEVSCWGTHWAPPAAQS